MKDLNKKYRKSAIEDYKKTLILLSILLAIMALVVFMPVKENKRASNENTINLSR